MPDVLIRNVPRSLVEEAKEIAELHGRTLQKELHRILEEGVRFSYGAWAETSTKIKMRLKGKRRQFSDSAKLLAEDRAR